MQMIEKIGLQLDWQSVAINELKPILDNELHLWHLPLELSKEHTKLALTLLSDIQADKYHRRATAELKHHYLAGRYYLLTLLAAYTQQTADQVELSYSRLNKPRLSDDRFQLEFNFTDTAGYGMFAFSKARQVGVDIERLDRKINISAIANRRFTSEELAYTGVDHDFKQQRGLAIWTRKEAFGKATGKGINFKMNQRNLYSGASEWNRHTFSEHNNSHQTHDWTCLQISSQGSCADGFVSSVVHQGHDDLSIKAFSSLSL